MNAITIKSLIKVYKNGTKALNGINLEVPEGDFFALLGANGAGKTTIIGILTGIVNKTSGLTKIFDINLEHDAPRVCKLIGVVPQEMNFNMFERPRTSLCRRQDILELIVIPPRKILKPF